MKYWQITTHRMSKAANKLTADGAWHRFNTVTLSWYRVWQKRLIQRIQFDSQSEESEFLPRLPKFEPLAEITSGGGFREELVLRWSESGPSMTALLGYPFKDGTSSDKFDTALGQFDIHSERSEGLLFCVIGLRDFEKKEIEAKQSILLSAKLLYDALLRGERASNAIAVFQRQVLAELARTATDG